MAETSNIAWTKSTFNPWIGCTKVSPGCDGCYAAVSTPARSLGIKWGAGEQRHRTKESNWNKVRRWNAEAPSTEFAGRKGFWPVFCSSLADVFDNEVPMEWRTDLFRLIGETPNLEWLLVTKRIGNVAAMIEQATFGQTSWPLAWAQNNGWPPNVRIMITVVNQEEADRDIPKLLALPCKNGISYEPALGAVDWAPWFACNLPEDDDGAPFARGIDWIIVGGESDQPGHKARPFNIEWARSTLRQCKPAGVPVFDKQLGSLPFERIVNDDGGGCLSIHDPERIVLRDRAGADPAEWPEDLRVREFPR